MIVTDELFEKYVEQYTPLFHKMINGRFITSYTKEDLIQECYMVLFNVMKTFDESKGAAFMTYLYTALRNHIVNLISQNNREKTVDLIYVDNNSAVIMNELYKDNFDSIDNADFLKQIAEFLHTIPRGEITYLHHFVGITQQEIADMEGITRQRVNYLNKRNIDKLKEHYSKGGFTL